ncbi:MAG: quaternary ammonium compound efflux SMR transporter SugE [Ignavibacteriaceae bacterium]|nr:quaternary ammonium compound efflux SMR transporter SugE [Ignavibacteriaceae bacterium]
MSWVILFLAGIFEISWAIGLKYSSGFSKFWPSLFTVVSMIVSMVLLSIAVKNIPIGTGYAIWTGIGAVGTAILGIFLFNEPSELPRLFYILLIIIGIAGLKIYS